MADNIMKDRLLYFADKFKSAIGLIILVIYSGHPGGEEEKNELLDFASKLDHKKFNVLNYKFLNQLGSPPQILAIKKRK